MTSNIVHFTFILAVKKMLYIFLGDKGKVDWASFAAIEVVWTSPLFVPQNRGLESELYKKTTSVKIKNVARFTIMWLILE